MTFRQAMGGLLGWLIGMAGSISLLAALGGLAYRIYLWASSAYWATSICEASNIGVSYCQDLNSGWKGIDAAYHWLVWQGDMTLIPLLVGIVVLVLGSAIMGLAGAT